MEKIAYTLERKPVKYINLRVRSDGTVMVSANPRTPAAQIDAFVQSKASFIAQAQESYRVLAKQRPAPNAYVTGETIGLLGAQLPLEVVEGQAEGVVCSGTSITLTVRDRDNFQRKERLMKAYLRKRCEEECMAVVVELHGRHNALPLPTVRLRAMKRRWGTCYYHENYIVLSTQLVRVPRSCMEYVVLHELCHFIHPDHSKAFHECMGNLMPDWEARKEILDSYTYL